MRSQQGFYVFGKWAEAPEYAFGKAQQDGIVPKEDKDAYWSIFSEMREAAEVAVDQHSNSEALRVHPKNYSHDRGSRGHRPKDLWVSVCAEDSKPFNYMPQIYMIASERGMELGFAASIPEDDYFDTKKKAENRSVIPLINAKLASPSSRVVRNIDELLEAGGNWHFNRTTRRVAGQAGFDEFSSFAEMVRSLKADTTATGGGCICRTFSPAALRNVDLFDEFSSALEVFAPILLSAGPDEWDNEILNNQATVRKTPGEQFDPNNETDGRRRTLQAVAQRQGQAAFRAALLEAYGNACAVSGTNVIDVLEAAHIKPFRGARTNHVTNGLLLRADIHTLYDLRFIKINPDNLCLEVSSALRHTDYWIYNGMKLRLPNQPTKHPDPEALAQH